MLKLISSLRRNALPRPCRAGISEADGTAADAKTGDKNGGRNIRCEGGKSGRRLARRGSVQEGCGEQVGRLAVSGGLVPTEPTNGGIARGGSAERIREGVTGRLPLEWVAPHEVGARERLFPTDESELRESGISRENPPKLPWAGNLPC